MGGTGGVRGGGDWGGAGGSLLPAGAALLLDQGLLWDRVFEGARVLQTVHSLNWLCLLLLYIGGILDHKVRTVHISGLIRATPCLGFGPGHYGPFLGGRTCTT